MNTEDLQGLFTWVRREFFPDWQEGDGWRIEFVKLPNATDAYCFHQTRSIQVAERLSDDDQIKITVIHEAGHAVCRDESHSKEWQEAMVKAAARAKELGLSDLAGLLFKESKHDAIATSLRDAAERYLDNSFHATVTMVAEAANLTREDVYRICPDAERVFKRARAKARRERKR
jgi:hypothetical protein